MNFLLDRILCVGLPNAGTLQNHPCVKGVSAESSEDIADSALLAQLVAKKKVPEFSDHSRVYDWYREYFNVLNNVEWIVQDQRFAEYAAFSDDPDVHKAALEVAMSLLGGPGLTAVVAIRALLGALKSASDNTP